MPTQNITRPDTCIIYARVSSKEQIEGTSLETQEMHCREYAKRMGWTVVNVFLEQGESAKTTDRTEFKKAIIFCTDKKRPVGYFLVHKLDRFARNAEDHIAVRGTLRRSGTELKSVSEQLDDSPMGQAMENITAVFAELDNRIRADRSKGGMVARVKEGIWCWAPPLGYHKPVKGKGTNIAPDPIKGPLVKLGFEEYSRGIYTYEALANLLAGKGLVTKKSNPPTMQLMEKLIHNPLYCGRIEVFDECIKGNFAPLISEELFDACQKIVDGRGYNVTPRSANNPKFPLRGFFRCSECNAPFTGSESTGRRGVKYPYYHHHGTMKCGLCRSIPKPVFEQVFMEYLDSLTPKQECLDLFKAVVMDIWKSNFKQYDEDNAKVTKEIQKLEQERQAIFALHRSGKYSDDEFKEQKIVIGELIKQKRGQLQTYWSDELNMDKALNCCFNFVTTASQSWLEADYKTKIQLQGLACPQGIEFDGQNCRTAKTALIYELKKNPSLDSSSLVASRGIEPLLTA